MLSIFYEVHGGMARAGLLRAFQILIGALMCVVFGFFLAGGEVMFSLASFFIGFTIVLMMDFAMRREASKERAVLVDERSYALAERSAYLAFRLTLIIMAVILFFTGLIPTIAQVYLLPKQFSDALTIGLGLGMGILVIAYYIAYFYYSCIKGALEGR
jgi:uncharacterized membrane protein